MEAEVDQSETIENQAPAETEKSKDLTSESVAQSKSAAANVSHSMGSRSRGIKG
jgi:hypothetical protein